MSVITVLTFKTNAQINKYQNEFRELRCETEELCETVAIIELQIQDYILNEEIVETEEVVEIIETVETEPTMYEQLSDYERRLIEIVIQHEVGNFSTAYKTYVAELIYNRIKSDSFPNTVYDVLFQKGQFQGIAVWSNSGIIPDEDTVEVVRQVFTDENPSHNCIAYYNPALSEYESIVWFEYSGDVVFVFEHTENNWGIDYTTRFFKLKGE